MEARTLTVFRNVVIGAFFLALAAGVFLPVYTDEVAWRFQLRAGFDGFDKLYSDTCGPNTLAVPPFFMMPVRYYSAFFNSHFADPMYVRFSGVGYAMAWALLLLWVVRLTGRDQTERSLLTIIGIGLMNLGMMPLLLIWSRPEQPILIATTAAIILALAAWKRRNTTVSESAVWAKCLFFACCGIVAVSYHVKGLIAYPVLFACLWALKKGRGALVARLTSAAILLVCMVLGAQYWVNRLQCPDDLVIQEHVARFNVSYLITGGGSWVDALALAGGNLFPMRTFGLVTPWPGAMSAWVYRNQISGSGAMAWYWMIELVWTAVLLASVACLALKSVRCLRNRRLEPRMVFSIVLLGSVTGWTATQLILSVYEATLLLPLLMMACLLALSSEGGTLLPRSWVAPLAYLLGLAALISPILVGTIYARSLAEAFSKQGYIEQQPYSVAVFGYSDLKPDIMAAAQHCGLTDKSRLHGLVIDDLTYFAFMDSYRPQHRLGVFHRAWPESLNDAATYLREIQSDGVIVGCENMDGPLRQRARRVGRFCCLAPSDW